jgi:hypothetical protein
MVRGKERVGFALFVLAVILAAFYAPLLYIDVTGRGELHEVASRIADEDDVESMFERFFEWKNQNIETVYTCPHFGFEVFPPLSFNLYVMPNYPLIYDRRDDPSWIMFFKRGACQESAVLFVEIMRIAGMQARMVYNNGEDHAWAEVMINSSWVHVDPANGYFDDPGIYERPDSENGWGKQLSYVYAVDENGEKHDITSRYTGTGTLLVRVEKGGKPAANAEVIVESRSLVDSGAEGYSDPQFATSSTTGDNGECVFVLGGTSYRVVAELGDYVAVEENVSLAEGSDVVVSLSLSPSGGIPLVVSILIVVGFLFILVWWDFRRRKVSIGKSIGQFKKRLLRVKLDLVTAAGVFTFAAGWVYVLTSFAGLRGFFDLSGSSRLILLSWMALSVAGAATSFCWSIPTLRRRQLKRAIVPTFLTATIGTVFWVYYGGFGFVVGAPIVMLSAVSLVLIGVACKYVSE